MSSFACKYPQIQKFCSCQQNIHHPHRNLITMTKTFWYPANVYHCHLSYNVAKVLPPKQLEVQSLKDAVER